MDKCICFGFQTNSDGLRKSKFSGAFGSGHFEQLARLMMAANPHAAIKAFGKAMQEVSPQDIATAA
jgi:hypothetical protein